MVINVKETEKGWEYQTPSGKTRRVAREKGGEIRDAEDAARIIAQKYGYDLDDISEELGVQGRMDLLSLAGEVGGAGKYAQTRKHPGRSGSLAAS